jgi:hypothetical protein
MGLRYALVNLLATHLDNKVGIDYYMKRSMFENDPKDTEHAYRLEERNSELGLELTKYIQNFFETLGLITNIFHIEANSQIIKEINEMIYEMININEDPEFKIPKNIKTTDDLYKWNESIQTKIREDITPKIASPIDKLLKYLENELKSESQPCELRCCFCRTP